MEREEAGQREERQAEDGAARPRVEQGDRRAQEQREPGDDEPRPDGRGRRGDAHELDALADDREDEERDEPRRHHGNGHAREEQRRGPDGRERAGALHGDRGRGLSAPDDHVRPDERDGPGEVQRVPGRDRRRC